MVEVESIVLPLIFPLEASFIVRVLLLRFTVPPSRVAFLIVLDSIVADPPKVRLEAVAVPSRVRIFPLGTTTLAEPVAFPFVSDALPNFIEPVKESRVVAPLTVPPLLKVRALEVTILPSTFSPPVTVRVSVLRVPPVTFAVPVTVVVPTSSVSVFIFMERLSILFLLIPYAVLSSFKSTRLFAIFVLLSINFRVILPKMAS